jgi:uncharacterized SAM-dependent methyltransferase
MTIYNHTVSFQDIERIAIENMVKESIEKFKLEHADDGLSVPWVWESILEKFRNAEMSLLSSNNLYEGGNSIFITPIDHS